MTSGSGTAVSAAPGRRTDLARVDLSGYARRTDVEVLYGQYAANERNIKVNMHIGSFQDFPVRLRVIPVMGSWEKPLNPEVLREASAKVVESLHVTVRPVYMPVPVAEINI